MFNEHVSGVIGLARSRDFILSPTSEESGPVIRDTLVWWATGNSSFSFTFPTDTLPRPDSQGEELLIGEVRVHDDFFWSAQTTAVRFGSSESNAFAFPIDEKYAIDGHDGVYTILDTGASAIYISNLWFDSFMHHLSRVADSKFEAYKGRTYARCSPNFPSIFILVDGVYLEVSPLDYVIDTS